MKNKKFQRIFVSFLIILVIVFLSVGSSSFQSNLQISDINAFIRVDVDVKIVGIQVYDNTSSALSRGESYNISNISSTLELPNSDSSMTYAITVTNLGNTEMGIFSITGLPDNLEYTTGDFAVGLDKICDADKCINGVERTIYLTIQYKENGYTETNTTYNINLDFDFRYFNTISYVSIDSAGLPIEIMHGGALEVTLPNVNDDEIKVTQSDVELLKDTNYIFANYFLTIPKVEGNIKITNTGDVLSDEYIDGQITTSGLTITSYGDGSFEIDGTKTSSTALYIRLTEFYMQQRIEKIY